MITTANIFRFVDVIQTRHAQPADLPNFHLLGANHRDVGAIQPKNRAHLHSEIPA